MVDDTVNQCRINENKEKYIHVHSCNSSLIHININHQILNDSLHTIDYACSQGEVNVFSSYRILSKKISFISKRIYHFFFVLFRRANSTLL
jgi:hypothetical protein